LPGTLRCRRVEIIRPGARPPTVCALDDPIGDFSIFPTYLVSQLASRHVKVVLVGDGGDELFGGYETYLANEQARSWQRVPACLRRGVIEPLIAALPPTPAKKGLVNKAKRFVEGTRLDPEWGHARWRVFCDEAVRRGSSPDRRVRRLRPVVPTSWRCGPRHAQGRSRPGPDVTSAATWSITAAKLIVSMACSIRLAFHCSTGIVEFVRLPSQLKFDERRTKILLKRVAARHVPHECVYRPKEGFSIPIKQWLRQELKGLVEHYLAPARLQREGLFQTVTVERLWREHLENRANHSHLLWSLLVFEQWRERWSVGV
jgi:asparagine synthase (glutamine-hydrolysing)